MFFKIKARRAFYEGEGGAAGTGTGTGTGTAPANGGQQNSGQQNPPPATLTQEQFNKAVAEERRKANEKNQQQAQQLEALRSSANLTAQQKEELAQQIESLRTEYQTKDQQQASEIDKLQKKYEKDTKQLVKDVDSWKARFEEKHISTDIYEAANEMKAFSSQQIYAILRPLTKAVEETGADGKPAGNFVSKVDFTAYDKEKKPVKLSLTVKEAVKKMTEMPELYGNLFRNEANPGLGLHSNAGTNGDETYDFENMTAEQYEKSREKILAKAGQTS